MTNTGSAVCVKKSLNLPNLLKELLPLASEWQTIGTLLGIPEGQLKVIRHDYHHQAKDCLREMISIWLKMVDPKQTLETLVEAVEVVDKMKAQDIKTKYTDRISL